jgi:hypothetical protein
VKTRKFLQRFRQFFADEERFWRALVLRVQRAYGVVLPPHVTLPSGETTTTATARRKARARGRAGRMVVTG